ncbi:MAG: tRNA (adenosine(37)-N6)-threonylcarbamoyltransferase complex dimerization subunit type 1 TsaB [Actinomycetes bacterium]
MLVLGLETSTARASVALVTADGVLASAALGVDRRHGEFLAPAVAFCLAEAQRTVADLTGVAVGTGPGLYTGLRVGIAMARTLATARGLPVAGLSGLDALAHAARATDRRVCAAVDARRGEVAWRWYRPAGAGVTADGDIELARPEALAEALADAGPVLLVGDALDRHGDVLTAGGDVRVLTGLAPDAAVVAELALPTLAAGGSTPAEDLVPLYLRDADARIGWQTRGRLQGGSATP